MRHPNFYKLKQAQVEAAMLRIRVDTEHRLESIEWDFGKVESLLPF